MSWGPIVKETTHEASGFAYRTGKDIDARQGKETLGPRIVGLRRRFALWPVVFVAVDTEEFSRNHEFRLDVLAGKETVVTDTDKAGRQSMEKKTANELHRIESEGLLLTVGVVSPVELDLAVAEGDKPVVGDRHPVGISSEVAIDVFRPSEGGLGVDDPLKAIQIVQETLPASELSLHRVHRELASSPRHAKLVEKLSSKELPEDLDGQEERFSSVDPAESIEGKASTSDDAVQVGMKAKLLAPGVENGRESHLSSQVLLVPGNSQQRFRCGLEEQPIRERFVGQSQPVKCLRECKDNMEVPDRQEPAFSLCEPFGLLQTLALRAVTIAAGVVS